MKQTSIKMYGSTYLYPKIFIPLYRKDMQEFSFLLFNRNIINYIK